MTYEHLVEKMQKEQAKFMPTIQQIEREGRMPEDLGHAVAGMEDWNEVALKKLGSAEVAADAPSMDPVSAFSNALELYQGMFPEKERAAIQLYREYASDLFDQVKGANIRRA